MRGARWRPVCVLVMVLALAACGPAPARVATGTAPLPGGPPPSTLTAGGRTQMGAWGSHCWTTAPDGTPSAARPPQVCADPPGIPLPEERLPVAAGATAVFTFGGPTPLTAVSASAYPLAGQSFAEGGGRRWLVPSGTTPLQTIDLPAAPAEREATIAVAVPAGEYVVYVRVRAQGGDASYGFHVAVQQ